MVGERDSLLFIERGSLHDEIADAATTGTVREGLYELEDMGVDIDGVVGTTNAVLEKMTPEQRQQVQYPVNAREWRCWSNPEFLLRPFGLRLEDLEEDLAKSILGVLQASYSPGGYEKALAAMRINHFLGQCCEVPGVMNQYSYNFLLFGQPSTTAAWGWMLYGHHLCVNAFFKGKHMVVSPTFTGAEPNIIDEGPWKGTAILHTEGELGLKLMQSLPQEQKDQAQIFTQMKDPERMRLTGDLKTDRWNQVDQRHLCGAFRDNRVVPYEGVPVASFTPAQQSLLLAIAEQFLLYLPSPARKKRLQHIHSHFPTETFFAWIGGYGPQDPFYYRLQSPVVVCEFDHHSGVFLTNRDPAKFHTHTIVRMPNQGDYGASLRGAGEEVP